MDLGYLGVKGILIRSVLYCKLLEEPIYTRRKHYNDKVKVNTCDKEVPLDSVSFLASRYMHEPW